MNRSLAMPTKKKIGKNTTTVVTVEAKIGMATSRAASRTASHRDCPMFRCRWMFSSSTIESSTNRPIDRKSTRLNSSHDQRSYEVFCLKIKTLQLLLIHLKHRIVYVRDYYCIYYL